MNAMCKVLMVGLCLSATLVQGSEESSKTAGLVTEKDVDTLFRVYRAVNLGVVFAPEDIAAFKEVCFSPKCCEAVTAWAGDDVHKKALAQQFTAFFWKRYILELNQLVACNNAMFVVAELLGDAAKLRECFETKRRLEIKMNELVSMQEGSAGGGGQAAAGDAAGR